MITYVRAGLTAFSLLESDATLEPEPAISARSGWCCNFANVVPDSMFLRPSLQILEQSMALMDALETQLAASRATAANRLSPLAPNSRT